MVATAILEELVKRSQGKGKLLRWKAANEMDEDQGDWK